MSKRPPKPTPKTRKPRPPEEQAGNRRKSVPPVEHRFKPGQSGNPGGRPKGITLSSMLRVFLNEPTADKKETYGERIARTLIRQAMNGNVKAIGMVADRTEGKVVDRMEIGGRDGPALVFEIVTTEKAEEPPKGA